MAELDLIVLGRKIGTYDSWDGVDNQIMVFYKFKPLGIELDACDLVADFEKGWFINYDEKGEEVFKKDILETIKDINRAQD